MTVLVFERIVVALQSAGGRSIRVAAVKRVITLELRGEGNDVVENGRTDSRSREGDDLSRGLPGGLDAVTLAIAPIQTHQILEGIALEGCRVGAVAKAHPLPPELDCHQALAGANGRSFVLEVEANPEALQGRSQFGVEDGVTELAVDDL